MLTQSSARPFRFSIRLPGLFPDLRGPLSIYELDEPSGQVLPVCQYRWQVRAKGPCFTAKRDFTLSLQFYGQGIPALDDRFPGLKQLGARRIRRGIAVLKSNGKTRIYGRVQLLQGLYRPSEGRIVLDGRDILHLAANELRPIFGVAPQETILFSGTIYDNLVYANPHAAFEQIAGA